MLTRRFDPAGAPAAVWPHAIARSASTGAHRRHPGGPRGEAGPPPGDPARGAARARLYSARRRAADCPGPEPVARRGSRGHQLLPSFPRCTGRPASRAGLPGGILPGSAGRSARRARGTQPRRALPPDHAGRGILARPGVLPGQLRLLAGDHDRRGTARTRDAGTFRPADRGTAGTTLMTAAVYVPRDAGALSLGAEAV